MKNHLVKTGAARRGLLLVLVAGLAVGGCAFDGQRMQASNRPAAPGSTVATGFAKFPDIPVPRGANMDMDRTLVLGTRQEWIGRLAIKTGHTPASLFDFYHREMGRFGWQPVATIRAGVSVLTFTRGSRAATIQITERTITGSLVDVTVSPRDRPPQRAYGNARIR